jgi:hypothetical protein
MKKLFILLVFILSIGSLNAQSTWALGASVGSFGNYSTYSGGMMNANARFHHDLYGTGSFSFVARKTLCPHWSFQTGIGLSSVGFNFALTQNYSLLNEKDHYQNLNMSTTVAVIPVSLVYNTNLNCRSWRWFIGGGFSFIKSGNVNYTSNTDAAVDMTATAFLPNQTYDSPDFSKINVHAMAGIEKVYKKGAILSFGTIWNAGFSNMVSTNVAYVVDGITYNHAFKNRGNYGGLYLSYYFRPLGTKKAAMGK